MLLGRRRVVDCMSPFREDDEQEPAFIQTVEETHSNHEETDDDPMTIPAKQIVSLSGDHCKDHQLSNHTAHTGDKKLAARKVMDKQLSTRYKHLEYDKVKTLYNSYIKDKKSAVCDNDDRSSCTASTCRTTIRKRRLQVKRNLFEDKKGKSNKRILIDLGQIDKMNMVHQYVLDSSKVMADVQKPKTEKDFCKDLLGDENREIIDVIKYQIRLEKYPGNRSFQSSLDIAMAKLQTAISKEHNTLKKVFLESKYNPKISGKLKKQKFF